LLDTFSVKVGNTVGILGALQKRTQPRGVGVNGYECSITIEDIKKIEAEIVVHGGGILVKPVEIPTVGLLIKFADTEGNLACAIQYFQRD